MNDFAGTEYEFAAGSLFGLRGWDMDEKGRLHGVTHREVWRPGENVSVCKQKHEIPCPKQNEKERARKASENGRAQVQSKKKKRGRNDDWSNMTFTVTVDESWTPAVACGDPTCFNGRTHIVPASHSFDPSCQCGFWAYDESGFARHGKVIGVIEGYGKTTVGSKGFRCEKARIASLCCEGANGERLSRSVLQRLAHLYPEVVFHETFEEMVAAHDGVLRQWPEVDETFWLTPVKEREDDYYALSSMYRRLSSSLTIPSSYFSWGSGA